MKFFTACNIKNILCNVLNKGGGLIPSELYTFQRGITAHQEVK
jgi:hypothetical protein